MIIECPACSTRYDIKVDLPAEGRTVRCAKCEHIWRAMPDADVSSEEPEEQAGAQGDNGADDSADAGWNGASAWDDPAMPSHEQEQPSAEDEDEPLPEPPSLFSRERQAAGFARGHEPTQEEIRKSSWFGGFLRKGEKSAGDEPDSAATTQAPDSGFRPAVPKNEEEAVRTLDDARAAVRGVFASIEEQRAALHGASTPASYQADDAENPPDGWGLGGEAEPDGSADEAEGAGAGGGTAAAQGWGGWEDRAPKASADGDLNDQLRAALQAHFQSHSAATPSAPAAEAAETFDLDAGPQEEEEEGGGLSSKSLYAFWNRDAAKGSADTGAGEGAQADAEEDGSLPSALNAFWNRPAPGAESSQADGLAENGDEDGTTAPSPLQAFWNRPLPESGDTEAGTGEPFGQEFTGAEDEPASEAPVFDDRLFQELEQAKEQAAYPVPRARGGALALAAAWGLFLCVAGGLTAGLFTFRDIVVKAVPGLASFYRTVGLPVAGGQALALDGVQYDWAVDDFKPILHVKGTVLNRSKTSVKAPSLLIRVKNSDPALNQEIAADLPGAEAGIEAEGRSEFEYDLASPGSTVTALELELRDAQ